MSIRSMTGFARARRAGVFGEITVSLRSVNHRAFDIHFHLPTTLEPLEPDLRNLAKKHMIRGHLDIRVMVVHSRESATSGLNRALFEAYLGALNDAKDAFGVQAPVDLNSALRIPGMLSIAETGDHSEAVKQGLLGAAEEAFVSLNEFRSREGREIAEVMHEQNRLILLARDEIDKIREGVTAALQARLQERLGELLSTVAVDPQRLAQEAAILAEKSDIHEEVARLGVHAAEVASLLTSGGEAGKKLDFLLQEMNRETNTILSKTNGLGGHGLRITELGIQAKSAIEKIREQASNLE
ncbi:MAG: YicC family protein [Bryobacterales bacterium]|nr:YicC family protein [Bryobacterales bacterium]